MTGVTLGLLERQYVELMQFEDGRAVMVVPSTNLNRRGFVQNMRAHAEGGVGLYAITPLGRMALAGYRREHGIAAPEPEPELASRVFSPAEIAENAIGLFLEELTRIGAIVALEEAGLEWECLDRVEIAKGRALREIIEGTEAG